MVQAIQVVELVGVLLGALELIDELDLAVQQRLVPSGEVHEHLVDALAQQRGLLGRHLPGHPLHIVERAGQPTDLVVGGDLDRHQSIELDAQLVLGGVAQRFDQPGHLLARQVVGCVGEGVERAGDAPAEQDGAADGGHECHPRGQEEQGGRPFRGGARRLAPGDHGGEELGLDLGEVLAHGTARLGNGHRVRRHRSVLAAATSTIACRLQLDPGFTGERIANTTLAGAIGDGVEDGPLAVLGGQGGPGAELGADLGIDESLGHGVVDGEERGLDGCVGGGDLVPGVSLINGRADVTKLLGGIVGQRGRRTEGRGTWPGCSPNLRGPRQGRRRCRPVRLRPPRPRRSVRRLRERCWTATPAGGHPRPKRWRVRPTPAPPPVGCLRPSPDGRGRRARPTTRR
ncbi:hypothetical protein BH23ACT2_BH23ACT2_04850 [soil metagenome]